MEINTKTMARIYQSQGLKKEALEIYKKLLEKEPNDVEIKLEIKKLELEGRDLNRADKKIKQKFIDANTSESYEEIERWLTQWS